MYTFIEVRNEVYGKYFECYFLGDKIKEVVVQRIKREKDGKVYLFLLNSNGAVIEGVYEYLNYVCESVSINVRGQIQSALKILYTFSEIVDKKIEDFNEKDMKNLSDFILGIDITGNYISIQFEQSREVNTHNGYLTAIREYVRIMKIDNEVFFETTLVESDLGVTTEETVCTQKYKYNISNPPQKVVPQYISIEEYGRITKYLEESKDKFAKRNKLIIDLMFRLGMRLGEVLGLTHEDIKENPKDKNSGIIIIRNRLSDRSYQHAKRCMKVKSKDEYKNLNYSKKNCGYQVIEVPSMLMEEIVNYIKESTNYFNMSDKVVDNILENAKADTVELNNADSCNYYLFINKNGEALSSSGVGKAFKKIYLECGIPVDKGSKKNNLSHKLRHGYAMFLFNKLGKDRLYVKDKLRHASLSSTDIYFNPTEEEQLNHNKIIEEKMLNGIGKHKEY